MGEKETILCIQHLMWCNKYTAARLVDISHRQAPWKDAHESGKTVIDIAEIRNYFLRKS